MLETRPRARKRRSLVLKLVVDESIMIMKGFYYVLSYGSPLSRINAVLQHPLLVLLKRLACTAFARAIFLSTSQFLWRSAFSFNACTIQLRKLRGSFTSAVLDAGKRDRSND